MNGVRVSVHQSSSLQRQAEIVLHHQVAIGRGGVGDRAHVDHGIELAASRAIGASSAGGTRSTT